MKYLLPFFLLLYLFPASCALSESAKKQASYHFQMGKAYLGEENITGALVELTEAEKLTPDDPELLYFLGRAYFRKNKYELAEQKLLQAISLKPNFTEARNSLGLNYLAMNRWDDAARQFRMVTDDIFYPGQETAMINLGRAYYGKGDYSGALTIFRSVVTANPRNPIARLDLGRVYFARDRTELAIEEYKRSIALDKNYAKAYYQLGLAYLKTKDRDAALTAFREVVRIAPDTEIGQAAREQLDMLK